MLFNLVEQLLNALALAGLLFLVSAGLSLVFGILRVVNFAHGVFYMLGAYSTFQIVQWIGSGPGTFWVAAVGAALGIAILGGVIERLLFRHLYGKEELYQLLFTYALAKEFRKAQVARERDVSFTELSERVNATMKTLRYDQISDVKGPKAACRAPVLGLPSKTRSR